MKDRQEELKLPFLFSAFTGKTVWSEWDWEPEDRDGMVLTERIGCSSLRLRKSEPGYVTDWHGSEGVYLIIVRRGALQIELRDGSTRDFGPGDAFIVDDHLAQPGEQSRDEGHRARVIGDETLEAIHIKLDRKDFNDRT